MVCMRLIDWYRCALVCAVAVVLLAGCAPETDERDRTAEPERDGLAAVPSFREVPAPVAAGSGRGHLATDASGLVYLSWTEPIDDSTHALRLATWAEEGWSEPRTVATGTDWFVNWADFPQVFVHPEGWLTAFVLARSGASPYAYDVQVTQSTDAGATWTPLRVLHTDGTQSEHGFVSMWASGPQTALAWLDGRATVETDAEGQRGAMTLRTATLTADGQADGRTRLDSSVCDCCQTAGVATDRGSVVYYRDRTADEIRDISVVHSDGASWSEPQPLHADGWQIAGCPVNGPAADAIGDDVAVAWFTQAGNEPAVRVAFSADGGQTHTAPMSVDLGAPLGRVDVLHLGDQALVGWLERTEAGARYLMRVVEPDGSMGPPMHAVDTEASRNSGFPRLVRSGDRLHLAWTDPSGEGRLRTAVFSL